ncbi:hypothetical protein JTB14_033638 [Gonioctena quinquepunctata]|nr:hypothetical protein JTB14_033638 [Gonioctena quinquepunctata]
MLHHLLNVLEATQTVAWGLQPVTVRNSCQLIANEKMCRVNGEGSFGSVDRASRGLLLRQDSICIENVTEVSPTIFSSGILRILLQIPKVWCPRRNETPRNTVLT